MRMRKYIAAVLGWSLGYVAVVYGGNPERIAQAGATQLTINPFARSSGLQSLNISNTYGIESIMMNPAGIAAGQGTEFIFANTQWLVGADIAINVLGFSHRFYSGNALGVYIMAFDLGEFERTTIDLPDGQLGTFSPTLLNLGISYGRTFVDEQIFVGATVKVIHEAIADMSASGIAIDGGVQYRSENQRFKIGVALRNIGPQMRFKGPGLSTRVNLGGAQVENMVSFVSAAYELPAQLNIGISYDIPLAENHRLTPLFGFHSYSFGKDNLGIGVEYAYKKLLTLRFSYLYEDVLIGGDKELRSVFTGPAAGLSFELPFKKVSEEAKSRGKIDKTFSVDYSFRFTRIFRGVHSIGVRINI